jgi:hypothetical protein
MALYEYRELGVQFAFSIDLHNLVPNFDDDQNSDESSECAGGGQRRLDVTEGGKNIKWTFFPFPSSPARSGTQSYAVPKVRVNVELFKNTVIIGIFLNCRV